MDRGWIGMQRLEHGFVLFREIAEIDAITAGGKGRFDRLAGAQRAVKRRGKKLRRVIANCVRHADYTVNHLGNGTGLFLGVTSIEYHTAQPCLTQLKQIA